MYISSVPAVVLETITDTKCTSKKNKKNNKERGRGGRKRESAVGPLAALLQTGLRDNAVSVVDFGWRQKQA